MEPTHSDGKAVQANAVSLSVVIGGGARDNVKVTDHRHMVTWKVCCWQAPTDAKLRGRIQHGDGSHANTSCLHSLQQQSEPCHAIHLHLVKSVVALQIMQSCKSAQELSDHHKLDRQDSH